MLSHRRNSSWVSLMDSVASKIISDSLVARRGTDLRINLLIEGDIGGCRIPQFRRKYRQIP